MWWITHHTKAGTDKREEVEKLCDFINTDNSVRIPFLSGKLITMVAGRPLEIKSFTQKEVNDGKILYQHMGYMQQWQQLDSIHLEVSTAYATPITGEVCDVDISFGNINSENQVML